jgi:endonuclease YncB( thermonuclease family)
MPLTLIRGKYSILKAAPDGDSIRFVPDNPALWKTLENRVRPNKSGGAQLRLDAIDALETHYRARVGSLGTQHQPLRLAHKAADRLLDILGFDSKTVDRGKEEIITAANPATAPGYILTRFADVHGRAVAFVFAGIPKQADGSDVFADAALIRQSANYQLLAEGLAYPTFYSKLFVDLRNELTQAVKNARSVKDDIWAKDQTNQGFELESLDTITDDIPILPKLFRRLIGYLAINQGSVELDGFAKYLEALDDRLVVLSTGQITGFDNLIEVKGQHLRLLEPPENLVFLEE